MTPQASPRVYWGPDAHGDRCNLCGRRFAGPRVYYEEGLEAPEPRQFWTICDACSAAVTRELAHIASDAPLRLRVALGVVAGERALPIEQREADAQTDERNFSRLLLWAVWAAFAVHALAFVVVVAVVALGH